MFRAKTGLVQVLVLGSLQMIPFGCTPKGAYGNTQVLRRVLRRFWKGFWERVLRRGSAMGFTVGKGSEKGSQKGF